MHRPDRPTLSPPLAAAEADVAAFLSGAPAGDGLRKGPWFCAAYDGECVCGVSFYEGDLIRADGDGGWEAGDCCGDD